MNTVDEVTVREMRLAWRELCTHLQEGGDVVLDGKGRTDQELAETTMVAAALRAGGAVAHGTHTLH